MSGCYEFEDALWEAAETRHLPSKLASHLESCDRCRHTLAMVSSVMRELTALRQVEAPDPAAAVRSRLARQKHRQRWVLALAGVAVVCGAAGTLALVYHQAPAPSQVRPAVIPVVKAPTRSSAVAPPRTSEPTPIRAPLSASATAQSAAEIAPSKRSTLGRSEAAPAVRTPMGEPAKDAPQEPESELAKPCYQVTIIVASPPQPVEPRPIVADPTYRSLSMPPQVGAAPRPELCGDLGIGGSGAIHEPS